MQSAHRKERMESVKLQGEAQWQIGEHTCCLFDTERLLAQVFECEGKWTAFDCTRPSKTNVGPRRIGNFKSFTDARYAVKKSLGIYKAARVMTAGRRAD